MSRALATLSFSIGMMAARMVLPTMLVSWRRWRMAASTLSSNSGDSCRQNSYPVGYYEIYGYGTPAH